MSYHIEERQVTHLHTVKMIECDVCGLASELKPVNDPNNPLSVIVGPSGFTAAGFERGCQFIRIGDAKHASIDACDNCMPGLFAALNEYCIARRGTSPPVPEGTH